jgi:hypothetical protein
MRAFYPEVWVEPDLPPALCTRNPKRARNGGLDLAFCSRPSYS